MMTLAIDLSYEMAPVQCLLWWDTTMKTLGFAYEIRGKNLARVESAIEFN